jgi:predicted Zn-dependent protease
MYRIVNDTNPTPTSSPWWRNDAVIFAALVAVAAVAFAATYAVTASYSRREDALARRWFRQGQADLAAGRSKAAVADFRTALLYSRDNPQYRLQLAQALAADNDIPQAIAYFLNLWEGQPGSGLFNLELARLYARAGDSRKAAQYYNNAIYGAWPDDPGVRRREARVEYIKFLMLQNQMAEAQAEAIALDAATPLGDAEGHLLAANLSLTSGDAEHALEEFSLLRKSEPAMAALGAGRAAFQLGRYRTAAEHLQDAIENGVTDAATRNMLKQAEDVLDLDPWKRGISAADRAKRVSTAYVQAGARLQQCAASKQQQLEVVPPTSDLQLLYSEWKRQDSQLSRLARDPDFRDSVMDLAFRIETATNADCGKSSDATDQALLALSRYGEAVQQ